MVEKINNKKKANITFFAMVIVVSAILETFICFGGSKWLYLGLMFTPAVAATIANCMILRDSKELFSFKKLFSMVGFRKCKLKYILVALLVPLIYQFISYGLNWIIFPQSFSCKIVSFWEIIQDIILPLIVGIITSLALVLGEEIGWRGYMVLALYERLGLNKMLFISSLFWCFWHLPLLISGDYMSGTTLWYQVPAFILCILPIGIIIGLITIQSGSIWPAVFLHAAHNNYDQDVFGAITQAEDKMYYVSETGILTIICAWIVAIIMFIRFRKSNKLS